MLGYQESEFGNTSEEWFRRIHPEDLESVQSEINAHLENGSTQFEIQHRMLHQDGCYRWMSCRGKITRDDRGRAVRITGVHLDITAEKVVDALTGLPNRLLLMDRLARSIEKAKSQKDFLFAVLILDLDLFESGLNRLETTNRDSLVIAAARRLETSLMAESNIAREGRAHLVARTGSEGFTILLDGLSEPSEAKRVAEQLLRDILVPFELNRSEVFLSASIGVALSSTGYRDAEEALRDADAALYRAKALGKSRCEVFDTAILESTQSRQQLEKDLEGALGRNELLIYYQPIVALSSNRIAGFEALTRWKHPSRGMIPPAEFLPIAEKTGLIIPLDQWVLQTACRQLKAWQQSQGIPKDLWVSVNVSGTQFMRPSLAQEIREILFEAGLDPANLMLELTEGAALNNPDAARSLLMQLRVMGARIALDDFGAGYSSLAHLRRLPLDYLKIDRSFVRSVENSSDTREIIRTISTLARQLGLRLIAEGIENSRQLDSILSLHCEYGQGFLFSKAVSSQQAESLLLDGFAPPGTASPEKSQAEMDRSIHPDPNQKPSNKRALRAKNYVLIAATVLVLLLMGGLLARWNRLTSPPVSHTSPPALQAELEKPGKAAALPGTAEMLPTPQDRKTPKAKIGSKRLTVAPKPAKENAPERTYTYAVVHDHHLGSCKGTIRIARDSISFTSERGKDSFDLKYSECSYALEGDRLTIKTGSRIFRFRSATAHTKDENRLQLLAIYQKISELHPEPASDKQ